MKQFLYPLWLVFGVLTSGLAFPASAHYSCNVDVNYGVVVSDTQLRVIRNYHTIYQINNKQQLFVAGEWVRLNEQQSQLIAEFALGFHAIIPQVTYLATAGVDLAIESVLQLYQTLLGGNNEDYEKVSVVIDKLKRRVEGKFRHFNQNHLLLPSSTELLDKIDEADLILPLSKTFTTSVGSILTSLGSMDADRMSADATDIAIINRRLSQYAENADFIGPPADNTLPQKARWYCDYFTHLDAIEEQIKQSIPALKQVDVIALSAHTESPQAF